MNNLLSCFYFKNCSLTAIATGERASSLTELRDRLAVVDEGCLYYHFWGFRMNSQFVHHQHHNDFSSWAFHRLHDNILAEKLAIIDPTDFSLETLRQELIETIERRLDEYEIVLWTTRENRFHFIRATIIVFDSNFIVSEPKELPQVVSQLTAGSIFYHFIDSRARTADHIDDFSAWLKNFGDKYHDLIEKIQAIDPYFLTLTQLKTELLSVLNNYFENGENYD